MPADGPDPDERYRTVRRAARDGVREALWDLVTVVIAVLLLALGVPLAFAAAGGGSGPAAWLGVIVGLFVASLGLYRLYERFWRPS